MHGAWVFFSHLSIESTRISHFWPLSFMYHYQPVFLFIFWILTRKFITKFITKFTLIHHDKPLSTSTRQNSAVARAVLGAMTSLGPWIRGRCPRRRMVMGSWSEKWGGFFWNLCGFIGIWIYWDFYWDFLGFGISWDFVLFFSRKILGSNEMEWDLMLLFVGIEWNWLRTIFLILLWLCQKILMVEFWKGLPKRNARVPDRPNHPPLNRHAHVEIWSLLG